MKKKKKKVARFTKGEKLLYALALICVCSTFVLKIFVSASASDLKIQIEKIKDDIELNKNFIKNIMEDNEKVKRGEVKNKIIEEKEITIKKQKEKIDFLQKELEKYYSEL